MSLLRDDKGSRRMRASQSNAVTTRMARTMNILVNEDIISHACELAGRVYDRLYDQAGRTRIVPSVDPIEQYCKQIDLDERDHFLDTHAFGRTGHVPAHHAIALHLAMFTEDLCDLIKDGWPRGAKAEP